MHINLWNIFCHASMKEEQFHYFAYFFTTLRNNLLCLCLKDVCVLSLKFLSIYALGEEAQVEHGKK